jgi:superfamily I DNA/RNA helicase/mRNA-degrading endonuclease RelE of RelBE toxin-antitoxin system
MGIQVAISQDFLTAILRLPRTQQKKVNQFVNKFRNDPYGAGINYEKINDAANPYMRSVRIDQSYRGIILKPEHGEVFILLWVDHHDEAYNWARRHQCKIHPSTGAIQLYASEHIGEVPAKVIVEKPEAVDEQLMAVFAEYSDEQLIDLGLPNEFIIKVRQIHNIQAIDELSSVLPNDAFEALSFIADGVPYTEVLEEYKAIEQAVDVDDFAAALEREGSKRCFIIVDDEALQQMLDAPLEKWRVFLHPTQRKLVERDWNGPLRVLGGAGTGKTVAAIHRAKWLANTIKNDPTKKILFTTFTKNLASDIQQHISQICRQSELDKIEVINIDSWVHKFLKRNNYSYSIVFPSDTNSLRKKCWNLALDAKPFELDFSDHFYEEEWRLVVQEQGISTKDEYIRAKRTGRGTRLNRKERLLVWAAFEEYLLQLNHNNIKEMPDATRDCVKLIESKSIKPMYSSIIVDEGQDMGSQAYELLRKIVPEQTNDIFIVGDGHQRIYRNKVVLGRCGIQIVGRSKKLRINYRTTEETKKLAVAILEGIEVDDMDAGVDDGKGYISLMHGENPEVLNFKGFMDEADAICERVEQLEAANTKLSSICVVARTKNLRDSYADVLKKAGISTYEIMANGAENRNVEGVRIATMHRVKGLEFQHLFVAGVNDDKLPLMNFKSNDPVEIREHEMAERALLHVAMTRAMKSLTVTSHGKPSKFLLGKE